MSFPRKSDPIPSAFQEVWNDLDTIEPLLTKELEEAEVFWNTQTRKPDTVSVTSRWSFMSVAIRALAAVMVLTIWWWSAAGISTSQYRTAKGEQQTITLDDGSTVMLNTETRLSVRFSEHERFVELERGEARFTVTHDSQRPFQVEAGNGMVQDLGTQFIVKKMSHHVEIFVFEGIVEVGLTDLHFREGMPSPRILKQGEQVRYTLDGHLSSIESIKDQSISAWTEGKLIFHAQPLNSVLKELARYIPGDIRLQDPTLADLPISGIFNLEDLESFPQALQEAFPVKATQINSHLVVLERVEEF